MKLLFDQNLSFKLCLLLDDIFQDSQQLRRAGLHEADDMVVWRHAAVQGYTLVTHDADFAELAALRGPPPKVIWLRCGNQPTRVVERLLRDHAEAIEAFQRGAAACLEIY